VGGASFERRARELAAGWPRCRPELRRVALNERGGSGILFEQLSPDRQEQYARATLARSSP